MKEYSLGLGTRRIFSISDFRTLQHFYFPQYGKFPLLPLHARANGLKEGVFLLVIFTKRRRCEWKCEISIQKDRLLRLKCTVRVERIDTHQYNRCLNHLIDTHQNNRSDWEINTEIEQLWFGLLPPWSVYVSGSGWGGVWWNPSNPPPGVATGLL